MAVRDIRLFGDPVLRTVAEPVGPVDAGVEALVGDLLDTVAVPGRAGVAANQIGVAVRAFSYNVDGTIGYLLDPELVEVRGRAGRRSTRAASRCPASASRRSRYPWATVRRPAARRLDRWR